MLDLPKSLKNSSVKKLKKSTIQDESNIYITVNEDAFNLLNNIKANDEKWDQFNIKKNLERIRSKVANRGLLLTQPKQKQYQIIMAKLANDEIYMMSDIPEDLDELEEGKSEDLDEIYDNILPNDNSTELPVRRTFFDMFFNDSPKISKSFENESSIADKKTRVTINSPSVFSSQLGTEYREIFLSSRYVLD
jgi:hypothetical protein